MYLRVAQRPTLRMALALTACSALLLGPSGSLFVRGEAGYQRDDRKAKSKPGKLEGTFPNLEDIKSESHIQREASPPIPSTTRSKNNAGQPWDGRRVGDTEPLGNERGSAQSALTARAKTFTGRRSNQTRRAHARTRITPPPVLDDQFVQNFFTYALARNPVSNETTYWYDQLRVAYGQGQVSQKLAAIELGRTMFESAEYAARNRDAHWYVYDLYKTYLMRDPDSGGWAFWEALVPTHGREYVRRGFEESTEFATLISNMAPNGSATSNASSLISASVDPRNQPGNGMLTRDAHWNVQLLSLPGRADLDLGLALSYSSQVWTHSGPYIYFDEDNGFPSPGFRLGFPSVQRKVFDAQTARNAYLLVTGSGRRVELRQVGTSNNYDAADASYLRLIDNGSTLLLYSTDGTKLSFSEINGEWRCTEAKDRNGNYITVNNNAQGRISTIVDTLGRVITFNYDGNSNLLSITQSWAGQPSHQWVSFGWSTRTMQSSFTSGAVVGTANGTVLPVITQVTLNDTSHNTFDYTNSLQLSVVRNYFDALERNATTFTYETPAGDAPRLLSSSLSAHNWSGLNNVPVQVTTQYSVAGDGACVLTAPDGTIYKEYYGTGWQKGLTTLSEVWSGGVKQKWTTTAWTQDNTSVSYEVNPRVTETNVYDASGNRRRTTIDYGSYAQFGLPYGLREYANDGVTAIRETFFDYNTSPAYTDRRIFGLVSQIHVSNVTSWQSKITYDYDDPARLQGVPAAATQHDTSYSSTFTARGNVTAVSRWDVTDIANPAKKLTSHTNYYNTGTPTSSTDASGHQTSISYADSFSDLVNRNTFAYPTAFTDADGFSATLQYSFDFGLTTRTQSPTPAGQSQGTIETMTYNNLGQLERVTTSNNSAYRRFWYGAEFSASYATINNVTDELYSINVTDGLGRVIGAASNHPGSSGGYSLVNTVYDLMGRARLQSNPTEVNNSWVLAGDDIGGIYYTQQSYDWQGRPLVTTNTDGTTREISYAGCGCAGGQVITMTDEGTLDAGVAKRRQQRIYSDVLGRAVKTETLNWQGGSVYSSTVNTFNARDQVTLTRQYAGAEGSGTFQDTTMTYDGYGRLASRHVPEQTSGTSTTYLYNSDDTVQRVTDARGAAVNYGYNGRHLVTGVSYTAPSPIVVPAAVTYSYDNAGNRTAMSDGSGSASYQYDQLSRLTSESRLINGLSGSQTIGYTYNLASELKSLTDPQGRTVNYNYDANGRMASVTGSGYNTSNFITNYQYRAWGAPKHFNAPALEYGTTGSVDLSYNTRLQLTNFQWAKPYSAGTLDVYKSNYQYYADGRIKFISDVRSQPYGSEIFHNFDRGYRYDHVGRLTTALTGDEARGGGTADGPYKQTYQYDVWGHMISRVNRIWSRPQDTWIGNYINNRNHDPLSLWQYDADGNATFDDGGASSYDASGKVKSSGSSRFYVPSGSFNPNPTWNPAVDTNTYDGDGQLVKHLEAIGSDHFTTYFVRSSMLRGAVIFWSEVQTNSVYAPGWSNTLRFASIYAGGQRIALSMDGNVTFEFEEPFTGRRRDVEPDPLGQSVGTFDPGPEEPIGSGGYPETHEFGNGEDPGRGCTMDGITIDCNTAMRFINSGAAYRCQNNDCSQRWAQVQVRYVGPDGRSTWATSGGWIGPDVIPDGSYTFRGGAAREAYRWFKWADGNGFAGRIKAGIFAGIVTSQLDSDSSLSITSYEQSRSDSNPKQDRKLKVPKVTEKGRPLSQCAQGLLRKFLEDGPYWRDRDRGFGIIDKVQLYSGIPDLIKKYAVVTPDAFTYGNNVWFRDGIDPGNLDNFSGLVLLAHEFAHNLQYDSASDAAVVFGALYLARSGTVYLQGKDPYTDNHYEVQAREFEAAFAKWLEREYGKEDPCKKFRGGK